MRKYFLLIMVLFLAVACLDDKTNSDYRDINDFEDWYVKGVVGLSDYSLYPGESVTITPTVRFSIDTLNPDASYKWYIDGALVCEEHSFTYNAEQSGSYELTFSAVDNKTGVAFSERADISVTPPLKTGWMFLSKSASEETQLSMLQVKRIKVKYKDGKYDKERDSLIYGKFVFDLVKGIGRGPIKLVENYPYTSYYTNNLEASEVMVVQESGPVELTGTNLTYAGRAEEEFIGTLPANFSVTDAVLTYGSKWLLTADHQLYGGVATVLTDLHTMRYNNDPVLNGRKFKALLPMYKSSEGDYSVIVAIDETNTMISITDDASPQDPDENYMMHKQNRVGYIHEFKNDVKYDMTLFKNFNGEYIQHMCVNNVKYYLSLLKRDGQYLWHYFEVKSLRYSQAVGAQMPIEKQKVGTLNPEMFTDFVESKMLPFRKTLIVASGNTLYGSMLNFDGGLYDQGKSIFPAFSDKIVSISVREFRNLSYAHVGVLLNNGMFYIIEVALNEETKQISAKQVFEKNLKAENPAIGEMVQVIFKNGHLDNAQGYIE